MVRDVGVVVLTSFLDGEMALLLKLLIVLPPLHNAISKLLNNRMITIPRFEINRTPRSLPRSPKHARFLKIEPSGVEQRTCAPQLFVIFVDGLI